MRKVARPCARRAVAVAHAAYALDGDDATWLARIADAARADLDLERGCFAFGYRIENGAIARRGGASIPSSIAALLLRHDAFCGGVAEIEGDARSHEGDDAFVVFARDGEGFGVGLFAFADAVVSTPTRVRAVWRRLALHLVAAARLRRLLVERARISVDPRAALIACAVHRAAEVERRGDAAGVWRAWSAGEASLVDRGEHAGKRYFVLRRSDPRLGDPRALSPLERAVLRHAALGASNKEIAFALGLSISTIASASSALLRKLDGRRRSDLVLFAEPPATSSPSRSETTTPSTC